MMAMLGLVVISCIRAEALTAVQKKRLSDIGSVKKIKKDIEKVKELKRIEIAINETGKNITLIRGF